MSSLPSTPRPTTRRVLLPRLLAVALGALLIAATALVDAEPARSHGSTISPPSRNYGCWKRWGGDFQNPRMQTEDPMCWQAWQADPNAMWNWNGLYRDGVGGQHQTYVPDGQLCSAGQTGGVRYAALDNPGAWQATNVNNNFSLTIHDQALHGADYHRVYVTRQGFNPLTQKPRWADLELVSDTGRVAPGAGTPVTGDPVLNGVSVTLDVSAPGRTGRHLVYAIWKASHSDQTYYFCSDVIFPGGGGNPTPAPTTPRPTTAAPATPTPRPTTPRPTTPPAAPTTPPAGGTRSCAATYTITNQWSGGFQAEVSVTAGAAGTNTWTVTMPFANGQTISQSWGADITTSGSTATARNVSYNGALAAGASTTFGFLGSFNGTNAAPALSCTAT